MIGLVELVADHGFEQVWEFYRANPVRLQDDANALDEGIEVHNLGENIVANDKVGLDVCFGQLARRLGVDEAYPRCRSSFAASAKLACTVFETYADFADRVRATKRKLLSFLIEAKRCGKSLAGYGAPGKGNTLLNYCGIRTDFLDYTVDRNPYKQGKYLPGTHIPIFPPEKIAETRPGTWGIADVAMKTSKTRSRPDSPTSAAGAAGSSYPFWTGSGQAMANAGSS